MATSTFAASRAQWRAHRAAIVMTTTTLSTQDDQKTVETISITIAMVWVHFETLPALRNALTEMVMAIKTSAVMETAQMEVTAMTH